MKLTYPELFYDHLSGQTFYSTVDVVLKAERLMKAVLLKDNKIYPSRMLEEWPLYDKKGETV